MADLYLLRHGETALNKGSASAERIRGHVDVPLNKEGKKEAVALGAKFATMNIGKVYTSDLQRAREVGLSIARASHAPIVATDKLRPWDLGIFTGKEVDKVIPIMNKLVEHPDIKIPQGESFNSFRMRYLPFLKQLLDEAKASSKDLVVVAHSRNLQLYKAWDKAGRPGDFSFDVKRMLDYHDEVPPGGHICIKP